MMTGLLVAMSVLAADEVPAELPQSPDRPSIASSELKGLRDNNVFSPHRTKPFEKPRNPGIRETPRPEAPSKPKPLLVTGLFTDPVTGVCKAVIEDRNDEKHRILKEPRFVVDGDEVAGITIESVTADLVVATRGEVRKELKLGESLPEGDVPAGVAPAPGASGAAASPRTAPAAAVPALDDGAKNDILEALKKKNKKRRDESEP